jgi:hypothetical protein
MPSPSPDSNLERVLEDLTALLTNRLKDKIGKSVLEVFPYSRKDYRDLLVRKFLDQDSMRALSSDVIDICRNLERAPFLADGRTISLEDALQCLSTRRHRGVFSIRTPETLVDLFLSDGLIRFVNPRQAPIRDQFGKTIHYQDRALPVPYLQRHFGDNISRDESIFFRMHEDGLIERSEIPGTMLVVSHLILADILGEPGLCTFEFLHLDALPERFLSQDLRYPAPKFLLNLCSSADEWRKFRQEILGCPMVFEVDKTVLARVRDSLQPDEVRVIDGIDGRRNVADVADAVRMNTPDVCRILSVLKSAGAIVEKEPSKELVPVQ